MNGLTIPRDSIVETYEVQSLPAEARLVLAWVESIGGVEIWGIPYGGPGDSDLENYIVDFFEKILRTDPLKFDMRGALLCLLDRSLLSLSNGRIFVDRISKISDEQIQ